LQTVFENHYLKKNNNLETNRHHESTYESQQRWHALWYNAFWEPRVPRMRGGI